MYYHLKTFNGNTEAVIDDNCGVSKFYSIAATLSAELKINFFNQVADSADLNTLDWDFRYKNQLLTLHYNIYNGVSVFPQDIKDKLKENYLVQEIANFLERRAY